MFLVLCTQYQQNCLFYSFKAFICLSVPSISQTFNSKKLSSDNSMKEGSITQQLPMGQTPQLLTQNVLNIWPLLSCFNLTLKLAFPNAAECLPGKK